AQTRLQVRADRQRLTERHRLVRHDSSFRRFAVDGANPPGFEPGPARLELAVLPLHHGLVDRARPAGVEPAASAFARQRSLSAELRACEEPPAGVEPAPRPYDGRVLAVDTTEARKWRRRESNPLLLGASEAPIPMGFIPEVSADGWSRTTTAGGDGVTAR